MEQEITKKEREERESVLLKFKEILVKGMKQKEKKIMFDDDPENHGYSNLTRLAEEAVRRYISERYGKICGWANSKTDKPYMKVSSKLRKRNKEDNWRTAFVEIFPENLENICKSQLEYIREINDGEEIPEDIINEFSGNPYEAYDAGSGIIMTATIYKRFNDELAPVVELKIEDGASAAGMWWSAVAELNKLNGETFLRTQLFGKNTGEQVTPYIFEHFADSTLVKVDYPVIRGIRFVSLEDALKSFVEEQVEKLTGTGLNSAKLLSNIYGKVNEENMAAEKGRNKLKAMESLIPEMGEGCCAFRVENGGFSPNDVFKPEPAVVRVGEHKGSVKASALKELFLSLTENKKVENYQTEITVRVYCFVKQDNGEVICYEPVYERYSIDGEGNYTYLGGMPITKYTLRIKVDSDDGALSKTRILFGNDPMELHRKKFSTIFEMMGGLTGAIKVNTTTYERQGEYYMSPLPAGSVERYNVLESRIVGERNGKDDIFFSMAS